MRPISPAAHRVLDFVTVAGFAIAPSIIGMTGAAAVLAYSLAVIHLGLTLITHFPGGATRPVPFPAHGMIEGVVGAALIALPFLASWTGTTRLFYLSAGVVIVVVWLLSRYRVTASEGSQ